jgi:phosphohistidine phosphatase
MDLYLIRHAEAVQREDSGTDDEARPLTPAGEEQARAVGHGLRRRGVRLNLLVTSPLLRARQTAEGLLLDWPEPAPELQVSDELAPNARRKKLAKFLMAQEAEAIGLVGHMPDLGEFAAWLLGSKKVHLGLAKAGVALVRCDGSPIKGNGSLIWMVTPEWLKE